MGFLISHVLLKLSMDASAKKITDDYKLCDRISHGTFGTIKKAICKKTKIEVAVKIISKREMAACFNDSHQLIINEISILKKTNHPNIIKYIDFYQDDYYYYIVMEYIGNGDLGDLLFERGLRIDESKKIFCQLLSCIDYCHKNSIVHRDIKVENILVTNKDDLTIKLIDFGLSIHSDSDLSKISKSGTLEYACPELLRAGAYDIIKADIWSMGVVLYVMITNRLPFEGSCLEMQNNIRYYNYDLKILPDADLQDLISKIFVPEDRRITIDQIKKHPWIYNNNNDEPSSRCAKNGACILM